MDKNTDKLKLGCRYQVIKGVDRFTGASTLKLKVGDIIDTGDGRFMLNGDGDLCILPKLRIGDTHGLLGAASYYKGVVEHQSQPTNPFNHKDLTIPEWATHAAQDGDTGCWYFYNMKPDIVVGKGYFKRGLDCRTGFRSTYFLYEYRAPSPLESIVERYVPFKLGDKVRVKHISAGLHTSKLIPNQSNVFCNSMVEDIGKEFVVHGMSHYGNIELVDQVYTYLPDWLELVGSNMANTTTELTPVELLKQRQQTFKVGDHVVLVGGKHGEYILDGNAKYDNSVRSYQGKVLTVEHIWEHGCDIVVDTQDGQSLQVSPDWIVKESEYTLDEPAKPYNHYFKDVSNLDSIDVYKVLELFNVTNPCLQHIIKKALVTGGRTAGKDFSQDLREIRDTAIRAVEMYEQFDKG